MDAYNTVTENNKKQLDDNSLIKTALMVGSSAALAACKESDDEKEKNNSSSNPDAENPNTSALKQISTVNNKAEAARFLQQASFSSKENEINELMVDNDLDLWITQQFNTSIEISAWDWMINQDFVTDKFKYSSYPIIYAMWQQLFAAPDVLRKRIALALSEIFVIRATDIKSKYPSFTSGSFWDMLNNNAFGNFRTLLEDVSLNPAMGLYLSTHNNKKANKKGRSPDENYAREILQLFSIGLYELNIDGSLKKDDDGNSISTYNQEDIVNLARVFTGWSFKPEETPLTSDSQRDPMKLNDHDHSPEAKNFLGVYIPEDSNGYDSISMALDGIFNHPNVGPFICKQLIQRLVKSNPSPNYIADVARQFNDNGQGQRGDMQAVIRALLLHPEARSNIENNDGKIREPMLRFIQWGRTFNTSSYSGKYEMYGSNSPSSGLAQSPLLSPSVFNFFRPGYVPPNTELAKQNKVAPEFQITDEVTVVGYTNFMRSTISYGRGKRTEDKTLDVKADYTNYYELATTPEKLVERLNLELTANQLNQQTIDLIIEGISDIVESRDKRWIEYRVKAAIFMIMASPDYIAAK